MPIFGSTIGVALGSSGSYNLPTTSSLPGLVFVYTVPTSSNTFVTSSVASIEANIINASQTGSAGELLFRVASPEDNVSKGDVIFKVGATGSNNEPRVGIGFEESENPIKAFDIKSKIDATTGTELLIRSSRTTIGGQNGDEAGAINFVIDTGSFIDITTTGSAAKIKAVAKEISNLGVNGMLQLDISRNTEVDVNMMSMFYNDSGTGAATYPNFYVTTTSHSFEVQDLNPQSTPQDNSSFIHSNGINPFTIIRTDNPGTGNQGGLIQVNNKFGTGTIFLHGPTGEITGSDIIIDDWGSVSASLHNKPVRTTFTNAGQISISTTTDQYYHYAGNSSCGLGTSIFNISSTASPTTITTAAGKYLRAGYVVPEDGTYNINFHVRAFASSNGAGETTAAELEGTDYDFLLMRSEPSNDDPNMSIIGTADVIWDSTNTSYPITGSVTINSQTLSKGDLLIVAMHGTENVTTTRYIFHSHTITLDK